MSEVKTYEGVKVRLDPSPSEERKLFSFAGGARFAYNFMLNYVMEQYKLGNKVDLSGYALRKEWNILKHEAAPWWAENSKEVYSNALMNLGSAFKNYFNSKKGKRQGEKVGWPKFKSRWNRSSFTINKNWFSIVDTHNIKIQKLGVIHCFENLNKRLKNKEVKAITVSWDGLNWYASIKVEVEYAKYNKHKVKVIGLDAGVKDLAILSDGTVIENNAYLAKQEKRLAKKQHCLARKYGSKKGEKKSNNFKKQLKQVNKIYKKVSAQRKDWVEKQSTEICKTYKIIGIENIKIKNMMSNRNLAKSIQDASMGMLLEAICRKAKKYNNIIYKIDTFYPSSKRCSHCGQVKAKLGLNERTYRCENCGVSIDRDLNAAINLRYVAEGASETINACGGDVRLLTLNECNKLLPVKQEPGRVVQSVKPGALIGNDKLHDCRFVRAC